MNDHDRYTQLFLEYARLPAVSRTKTLMEVSGYPHYENVASNILAFFLRPEEEHGLHDLLLKAFAAAAGVEDFPGASAASVRREVQTEKGGRLDLLVDTGGLVLGIENKIYHHPNNDFADYAKLIEDTGAVERQRLRIVLSPKPIRDQKMVESGFVSVTYPQLWGRVRELLGHHAQQANTKWLSFLFDFMETTTRQAGEQNGFTAADEFLIKNHETVEHLLADRQKLMDRLYARVGLLHTLMEETPTSLPTSVRRWIWKGICLVHDFEHGGKEVALDLNPRLKEWNLTLLHRSGTEPAYLNTLRNAHVLGSDWKEDGERYLLQTWPPNTPLDQLQKDMTAWVQSVAAAMTVPE